MPGIYLYMSNRMEILMGHLTEVMRSPLPNPFQAEIIIVQSRAMERWISLETARRLGICANISFPHPITFAHDLFRKIFPDLAEPSPYEPLQLVWTIMAILPSLLKEPGFDPLQRYLDDKTGEIKHYQLSLHLARLFDRYLLFRPEMIEQWDEGREDHWQATMWRKVVSVLGPRHRVALYRRWREAEAWGKVEIPSRISVFGISTLPPYHLRLLTDIARVADIHLFLSNPCREYWGDIVAEAQAEKLYASTDADAADLHLQTGNRLLSSLGKLSRDFLFQIVPELPIAAEVSDFEKPGEDTILKTIQGDILALRERTASEDVEVDDSLRIAVCYGPLREVEALHDFILDTLSRRRDLKPHDILVMAPDISRYAPFIRAVFSPPEGDPRRIPYTIADEGRTGERQVTEAFLRILDLGSGRLKASQVLDLLASSAVSRRFSFSEEELELVTRWVRETGIRWGWDATHRASCGLPAEEENTWTAGIARLLIGYAMPENAGETFCLGTVPYSDVDEGDAAVLGRFLAFLDKTQRAAAVLKQKKTVGEWVAVLLSIIDDFLADDDDTREELVALRRVLDHMAASAAFAGPGERMAVEVIRNYLCHLLTSGEGGGFLSEGVTFASLMPMRGITFPVICLIGMDDDAYPRRLLSLDFDLMAASPRPGDRNQRDDDRHLFLEAILNARSCLYISYGGRDPKNNTLRPPSVLVGELLDYLEDGFGSSVKEGIVVHHRLQAFNPDYFHERQGLFSYSAENFRAALTFTTPPRDRRPWLSAPLNEETDWDRTIDIGDIIDFFSHPVRFFVRCRLGAYLDEDDEMIADEEPFDIDAWDRYFLMDDMVSALLSGSQPEEILTVLRLQGRLPHGAVGRVVFRNILQDARRLAEDLQRYMAGGPLPPRDIDLKIDGLHLKGRLGNLYPSGLVLSRPGRSRPADRIGAWIRHLIMNCTAEPKKNTYLLTTDRSCIYVPPRNPHEILTKLTAVFRRGMLKPLPIFPRSSLMYAQRIAAGDEPAAARRKVWGEWEDYRYPEKNDVHYDLCFPYTDPFDDEFADLALTVFGPMLDHEQNDG